MKLDGLDHFVLTVVSIEATCNFYAMALGMEIITFGEGRKAMVFGEQKTNLHQAGTEFLPKAERPTPGSGDFCLLTSTPLKEAIAHLKSLEIAIEEGPSPAPTPLDLFAPSICVIPTVIFWRLAIRSASLQVSPPAPVPWVGVRSVRSEDPRKSPRPDNPGCGRLHGRPRPGRRSV